MALLDALRLRHPSVSIWHHAAYRLPLPALDDVGGLDLRRADLVAWFLTDQRLGKLRVPEPASYRDLARVHTDAYLESLADPAALARIFALDASQVPADEVMRTVRLAVGATTAAARECLHSRGRALNLLGGFHHAAPDRGAGLCAINDIAVALAALRADGFAGRAVVLDLDAHPPDGTAACLRDNRLAWIGSLSASNWGPLPGVDEIVLAPGTRDDAYLRALDALLGRMPPPDLAFVVAGGDVVAGDHLGRLALTFEGARERDLRVIEALGGTPAVWLPGGGYQPDAWRVLAGTGLALLRGSRRAVNRKADPLQARFQSIARDLPKEALAAGSAWTQEDLEYELFSHAPAPRRLLGFYGAEGVEYALGRYGLLSVVERLGYSNFRVEIDATSAGDRARLFACADGKEHLLVEVVLGRERVAGRDVLYVHWLELRNPRGRFDERRPQLPGQNVPGLGMAREVIELLDRMAERLGLDGVAFRPAYYHTAYVARTHYRFIDPARQARFEALLRQLSGLSLAEATRVVTEHRASLDGKPYEWEPDIMVAFRSPLSNGVTCRA